MIIHGRDITQQLKQIISSDTRHTLAVLKSDYEDKVTNDAAKNIMQPIAGKDRKKVRIVLSK